MFDPNLDTKTAGLSYHPDSTNQIIPSFICLSAGMGEKACSDHRMLVNGLGNGAWGAEENQSREKNCSGMTINTKSDCLLSLLKGHVGLGVMSE